MVTFIIGFVTVFKKKKKKGDLLRKLHGSAKWRITHLHVKWENEPNCSSLSSCSLVKNSVQISV